MGLGGGVEGGGEGIGPGVATGGVGAPAAGGEPAVAPASALPLEQGTIGHDNLAMLRKISEIWFANPELLNSIIISFLMNPKVDKAIYIVLGSVSILSILAYLILGKEWARLPFYLSLSLVSLYNLFLNHPGSGTKKE